MTHLCTHPPGGCVARPFRYMATDELFPGDLCDRNAPGRGVCGIFDTILFSGICISGICIFGNRFSRISHAGFQPEMPPRRSHHA